LRLQLSAGFFALPKRMKHQPHILIVCTDPALMQVRKLVLGTYFQVKTAGRVSEAAEILSGDGIDLVVLCETLSDRDRSELMRIAADMQSRALKLSLLRPESDHQEALVEQPMAITRGPLQLLKECADTLGVILTPAQRGRVGGPLSGQV